MITKSLACRKLGIEPKSLLTIPQITPMLTEIAQGLTDRGLPSDPYYYLNASSDLEARGLMAVYNQCGKQVRDVLPLEAFCAAAGVDPNRILDCIIKSIERLNALSAAVKLSVSQGEVVDATVSAARDIDNGHKDRRLHMQVSGLMPMPRGARTVVNVQTSASATAAPVQAVIAAPSPEQTVRRLSERLHAVRAALPEISKVEDAILVDDDA